MKHLIVCREYPPAPSGGIGVYVRNYARLLAERGDTVHVIGQLWEKPASSPEMKFDGKLIIHRVPYENGASFFPRRPHPALDRNIGRRLFNSEFPPQCFSWHASLLAELLVKEQGIDVIEAQEYEAPLYYFQLRRALGMGPAEHPPCVVHLHSPTEFIARYNEWDSGRPDVVVAKRLEDYSIGAADSLLCPSEYLARQAESHYGLTAGTVKVIPYPIGESRTVPRSEITWADGTICFMGRLEPRKGVFEWIDAAAGVARTVPTARFDFIGADTIHNGESVRTVLERRIPGALRSRFRFYGERPRHSLPHYLAGARMAVVPSRWENFPNSCIEAMASGLPVIASREGGMAEMIVDGQTGWLSETQRSENLADALRRALETTPHELADMGRTAANEIRRMCSDDNVAAARADFHRDVRNRGATQSVRVPRNLAIGNTASAKVLQRSPQDIDSPGGIALVITSNGRDAAADECLKRIASQKKKPVSIVIALHGVSDGHLSRKGNATWPPDVQILQEPYPTPVSAKNAGIEATMRQGRNPLGVAILSAHDRLNPDFVSTCESVLKNCPEVGLVSCWTAFPGTGNGTWIRPCPSFPYQWMSNDAAPFSIVRTSALCDAGYYRPEMKPEYADWDLCNAIMANGWIAVTIPEFLAEHPASETECPNLVTCEPAMRAQLLARFPALVSRDARQILEFAFSNSAGQLRPPVSLWKERLDRARVMIRYPSSTARQIYGRLRTRFFRRASG